MCVWGGGFKLSQQLTLQREEDAQWVGAGLPPGREMQISTAGHAGVGWGHSTGPRRHIWTLTHERKDPADGGNSRAKAGGRASTGKVQGAV